MKWDVGEFVLDTKQKGLENNPDTLTDKKGVVHVKHFFIGMVSCVLAVEGYYVPNLEIVNTKESLRSKTSKPWKL